MNTLRHILLTPILFALTSFLLPTEIIAQHNETSDSLKVKIQQNISSDIPDSIKQPIVPSTINSAEPETSDFKESIYIPLQSEPASFDLSAIGYKYTSPLPAYIKRWDSGILTGYNNGYGNVMGGGYASGVTLGQQWGQLSLNTTVNMSKSHYAGIGTSNTIGINANLAYHISDNARLVAFGGMNTYGLFSPHSLRTYNYGGYLSLNTENKKVGMNLGMRRYFDPLTGRWINVPIVAPYVNLWGQDVGLDLGYMLMRAIPSIDKALNPKRSNMQQMRYDPTIIPDEVRTKGLINMSPVEVPKSLR